MRVRILIAILAVSMLCPSFSHGFGLLRYAFDAISNQLGLDRGPVPKVPPKAKSPLYGPDGQPLGKHADTPRIHIQAEGF
ncbi:MAG: hypothetical protein RDU20_18450 [Desulfomonilaceae bacterium]|nr:hypothetical protein [Desulfomonilaceae bacterium]